MVLDHVYANPDKKDHHLDGNFPQILPAHPSVIILVGPAGCGKNSKIENFIHDVTPRYEIIEVVHPDPEGTDQYDNAMYTTIHKQLPPLQYFRSAPRDVKKLLIIDETNLRNVAQDLHTILTSVPSHLGWTIFITAIDYYHGIPTSVRRRADIIFLWTADDVGTFSTLKRSTGVDIRKVRADFGLGFHDCIAINTTGRYGHKCTINGRSPVYDYCSATCPGCKARSVGLAQHTAEVPTEDKKRKGIVGDEPKAIKARTTR